LRKVALIADLHFGVKKSDVTFFASQKRFFENCLVPDLKKKKIKDLFILGDVFDHRHQVNVNILSEVYNMFKNTLAEFDVRVIVGNHDTYFKSTTEVNSVSFLNSLDNVRVYSKPEKDWKFDDVFMVPWIADEKSFFDDLVKCQWTSKYCFGHFEFNGYQLNKYSICECGLDSLKIQNHFSNIFTGHFHGRSSKQTDEGIIQYIGSPYQINRNDIDDVRGYTILDLDKCEQEFVPNNVSMRFLKIKYPETPKRAEVKGNIVDVEVVYDEKYNESNVQMYVDRIDGMGPAYPVNIVINNKMIDDINQTDFAFEIKSVEELLKEYVDGLDIDMKNEVKERLLALYDECSKQ